MTSHVGDALSHDAGEAAARSARAKFCTQEFKPRFRKSADRSIGDCILFGVPVTEQNGRDLSIS
jgi:hypothetical protein